MLNFGPYTGCTQCFFLTLMKAGLENILWGKAKRFLEAGPMMSGH